MSSTYVRAPHASGSPSSQPEAPNAALLIDFDNVTMGMRSDLSKELKNLLNSDIIKGKVTVQRAYADWRRYPQYIVPLSENSVDLIFAPAYGSSKKNATDIRMAIDGMELVFIRPEIGTYILLTGDSDFSSLVLKLKEYGKYVIGVGIQESSSDILVQNCDEYYSYTSLSGLRKTTDSANKPLDPWVLVEEAVQKMASRNDVMRSDRLKQVMMEIDPSFDEGNFGFSKFSKFLSEASSRNLVALRKLENGQYEVQPAGQEEEAQRGRGGGPKKSEGKARPRGNGGKSRPEASAGEDTSESVGESPKGEQPKGKDPRAEEGEKSGQDPLRSGYELLHRALDLLDKGGEREAVRDSDLKRKMLELDPSFDEGELGFGKFSRFLRQAHDHEIIDLEKREEGTYQVSLPKEDRGVTPEGDKVQGVDGGSAGDQLDLPVTREETEITASPSLRLRRGEGGRPKDKDGPPPILEGQVIRPEGQSQKVSSSAGNGQTEGLFGGGGRETPVELGKLGLPTGRAAVIRYLTNSYKGVGKKTAESLVDSFGGDLFRILAEDPDRISSVVAGKRAEQLLEAWKADYRRRMERAGRTGSGKEGSGGSEAAGPGSPGSSGSEGDQAGNGQAPASQASDQGKKKSPPKRRTRRGGRGRRQ